MKVVGESGESTGEFADAQSKDGVKRYEYNWDCESSMEERVGARGIQSVRFGGDTIMSELLPPLVSRYDSLLCRWTVW